MIGLDRVAGYFTSRAVQAWKDEGRPLASVRQITSGELAARMMAGEVNVIDVRGAAEWEAGHLPDVPNLPVGSLADRLDEVPRDRPLVVHCQGGGRSAIAASVLQAHGITGVLNLTGGYQEWVREGHPVETGAEAMATA
ncbi:MAG TPA: rhodanese-like domain-containing protein, partial [Longimicrobium sp.]|nr:rhodanese-like domain-containing protein [Longimicrobium sp.]